MSKPSDPPGKLRWLLSLLLLNCGLKLELGAGIDRSFATGFYSCGASPGPQEQERQVSWGQGTFAV